MRKILFLFVTTFLMGMAAFSQSRTPPRNLDLEGIYGYLPSNSVSVRMVWNNTLVTTFYKNMEEVTVTVKKQNGEIVSTRTMNAEEYNTFSTEIKDYSPGQFIITIETPEGGLEGRF